MGEAKEKPHTITDVWLQKIFPYVSEDIQDEVDEFLSSSKKVKWHVNCRRSLKISNHSSNDKEPRDWFKLRNAHKEAFYILTDDMQKEILMEGEYGIREMYYNQYMSILSEMCDTGSNFKSTHIKEKLENHFGSVIEWHKCFGRVIFCREDVVISNFIERKLVEVSLKEVAFWIRKEILSIPKKKLINDVKLEDIYNGDSDLPPLLTTFMKHLIVG